MNTLETHVKTIAEIRFMLNDMKREALKSPNDLKPFQAFKDEADKYHEQLGELKTVHWATRQNGIYHKIAGFQNEIQAMIIQTQHKLIRMREGK